MSTKFFTWTKGDRRNATAALGSGGIVPIPAECITIKGMDYARNAKGSNKAGRKPLPLQFDQSPVPSSKHSSRTNESIALQDAAVQSATNLMAVMNDMLRSPQLSAHIQQRSAGLAPLHGRPRSHTAPSTPLVEAPSNEPVELPGSLPIGSFSNYSFRHSTDAKGSHRTTRSSTKALYGAMIERPHSSPQEATHSIMGSQNRSTDDFTRTASTYPPPHLSPRLSRNNLRQPSSKSGSDIPGFSADGTPSGHDGHSTASITQRPSLATVQMWPSKSPSISGSVTASNHTSISAPAPFMSPSLNHSIVQVETRLPQNAESVLMEQMSMMRASHDSHLRSLRDAHEKEIETHRSYIQFLEKRHILAATNDQSGKQGLTIDTSHGASRATERVSLEASATTLQSFESSLENKKRISQETTAEVEALKRKLSICRKEQAESAELQRERDQLRDAADRSTRRISQLKNIVHKAKDNDKVMKAATADLEARLEAANMERIDVLEGFHDACEETRKYVEREKGMIKELEELRGQMALLNQKSIPEQALLRTTPNRGTRVRHVRALSDAAWLSMGKQVQSGRSDDAKDAEMNTFSTNWQTESLGPQPSPRSQSEDHIIRGRHTAKVAELESALAKQNELLLAAQADCERYNSLLQSELRRQSRFGIQRTPALGPQIDAEASAAIAERLQAATKSAIQTDPSSLGAHNELAVATLEKELQHCLKEIIMFKLDVRGYKKDLKKAHAQIETLQAIQVQRPPTPESQSSIRSTTSSQRPGIPAFEPTGNKTPDSGLGISLPQTPAARSVTSATVEALLATIPSCQSVEMCNPPSRSKTPLGAHKKLPRPPPPSSRTPSPMPGPPATPKLQRGETLRSVSDSIISSYAQRSTPEQGSGLTPPAREARRSAPARSLTASPGVELPLSKFTSELMRAATGHSAR